MTGTTASRDLKRVNDAIDKAYKTPGVYVVVSIGFMTFMEVLEDGTCYGLNPYTYKRDNILSREGWNPGIIDFVHGPLPFKEDR